MKGDTKVFLEKGCKKIEVSVEKLIGEDGPRFWFKDKKPGPPQQQVVEKPDEQSVTEDATDGSTTEEVVQVMSEVDQAEVETGKKMWLSAKVTSLEKENRELKRALQEVEAKIELQGKNDCGNGPTPRRDGKYNRADRGTTPAPNVVQRRRESLVHQCGGGSWEVPRQLP